ncbi:UDP-galactopyranose mutase [Pararhodobacter oceanensis]|uniref:UDP-galactopyranose/dTDP-fucopyranose mutase family protein n=1 Tax=Pararhodobacter oceanensis TaxID=2172121 RepID=UPI003A8EC647
MTRPAPYTAPNAAVLVVGAGLSGAVLARELAEAGWRCHVIDARPHVGGNCHTARDPETGVMVHTYGPHIFHTGDAATWAYVTSFARFRRYTHRVKTTSRGAVYGLPINLHTINQFYGKTLRPAEAEAFLATQADTSITTPRNFEEQALRFVGRDLYEAFFKGYTQKQWGCAPRDLPAAILQRLPLRFTYDDGYFNHPYQGMPEDGYTALTHAILAHPAIRVSLSTAFTPDLAEGARHIFWTGALDGYFDYTLGRLGYRTLEFERFTAMGDYQGCAVMNYADAEIPYTRITEHKHFAPWESHAKTTCYREYSRAAAPGDIPFYPIRLVAEQALLKRYVARAKTLENVSFIGRLGTYRYLDMDVTIREARAAAARFLAQGGTLAPFHIDPLA